MTQVDSRGKLRSRFQTVNDDESLTVQSDEQNANVNEILRKFKAVGIVDHLNRGEAMFPDISEFTDFADAMRIAKEAEREFDTLPSKIREIFHHDVAEWLDAAHDQEKRDALVAAGIIEAPVEEISPAVDPAGEAPGALEVLEPPVVAPVEAPRGPEVT